MGSRKSLVIFEALRCPIDFSMSRDFRESFCGTADKLKFLGPGGC